jgi:vacuolar-type H+-ATPase subunit C/Vma6
MTLQKVLQLCYNVKKFLDKILAKFDVCDILTVFKKNFASAFAITFQKNSVQSNRRKL